MAAKNGAGADMVPGAHDPATPQREPRMLTSDLALRLDPEYEKISRRFLENPEEFRAGLRQGLVQAAAPRHGPGRALPRPLGRRSRSCGRTRCPAVDHELVADDDVAALKATVLDSGLTVSELVSTAWASAASFRTTDKRGGANGARIRLEPQRSWAVNQPEQLAAVLEKLEGDPARRSTRRAARRSRWPT